MSQYLRQGLAATAAAVLLLGASGARPAAASTFSVNPTQIHLTQRAASALLSLRNDSTQPLRFELSVFSWTQSASGEMKLEPTEDIVFFPSLLTLKPSEERKVRVGSTAKAGAYERTYRIFVKELPPIDTNTEGGVRVLTTMGIPIFLRPAKDIASAELNELRQVKGQLQFALTNTGTVHFIPQQIKVTGLAGDSTLFEHSVEGWYVLAAGRRDFTVTLPEDECAKVTSLMVQVEFFSARLEERLQTPGGTCGP